MCDDFKPECGAPECGAPECAPECAPEFFESIDKGSEMYQHQRYGGELERLISTISGNPRKFIYNIHFLAMNQRMIGEDPTTSYRKGIRSISNIPENIKSSIIDKLLKIIKDSKFCESSQLKLFINLVKMFLQEEIHSFTEDNVKILIKNWVEEITPEEKKIINNLF